MNYRTRLGCLVQQNKRQQHKHRGQSPEQWVQYLQSQAVCHHRHRRHGLLLVLLLLLLRQRRRGRLDHDDEDDDYTTTTTTTIPTATTSALLPLPSLLQIN